MSIAAKLFFSCVVVFVAAFIWMQLVFDDVDTGELHRMVVVVLSCGSALGIVISAIFWIWS